MEGARARVHQASSWLLAVSERALSGRLLAALHCLAAWLQDLLAWSRAEDGAVLRARWFVLPFC